MNIVETQLQGWCCDTVRDEVLGSQLELPYPNIVYLSSSLARKCDVEEYKYLSWKGEDWSDGHYNITQ
jgi:hypothetical protein